MNAKGLHLNEKQQIHITTKRKRTFQNHVIRGTIKDLLKWIFILYPGSMNEVYYNFIVIWNCGTRELDQT